MKLKAFVVGALCVGASLATQSASFAAIVTLDFTNDDMGQPLIHGQVISTALDVQLADTVFEFGSIVSIRTTQGAGGHLGAVIFDSTPGGPGSTLGDPDLDLLINQGNVLTLQDPKGPNTTATGSNGLVFNNPDDVREFDAGSIIFDFVNPIEPISVDIIDADRRFEMEVILTDVEGATRTYLIPEHWTFDLTESGPKGFDTLLLASLAGQDGEGAGTDGVPGNADDLTTVTDLGLDETRVISIEFRFLGLSPNGLQDAGFSSGAIDNLTFNTEVIPEPSTVVLLLTAMGVGTLAQRRRRVPQSRR